MAPEKSTAIQSKKTRVFLLRSNPIAPDPRVEKIARALGRNGYSVGVLGWDRSGSLPEDEKTAEFSIHRLALREEYQKGLGNLSGMLRWQWRLLTCLIQERETFDILHACDFDTILPALYCQKFFGKRVVYDIFDFYADFLRRTPDWIKRIVAWLDRKAINAADAVILADDSRVAQIQGTHPKALAILFNSPEDVLQSRLPDYLPSPKGELRVAYVGLLQVERGIFEMLDVFSRHPTWQLEIGGFGGEQSQIVERIHHLPNVTFHGRLSYDQTLAVSQRADVLFATYDPAIPNHRYSSPNKVFEAMMLSKPIITAQGTNADRIALEAGNGVVVSYGAVNELDAVCCDLANDRQKCLALGKAGRNAYEEVYSWDKMSQRLLNLYAGLACADSNA